MYSVKLLVSNLGEDTKADFEQAVTVFIEDMDLVDDLKVIYPKKETKNTRGDVPFWVDIIITGVTTGAFMAIYMLAKDMFEIYANAEVELTFEDGSSIKLKHLTPKEAQATLRRHLNQSSSQLQRESLEETD